jgi:hypothetical protein
MNRIANTTLETVSPTGLGLCTALCSLLVAGCNTVVPTAPGAAPPPSANSEPVTIEHSSVRSRTSVYESALKACKQRGHEQAVFRSQANEDPQRPPATGPQLSTFTCR